MNAPLKAVDDVTDLPALMSDLAQQAPDRALAWDAGCGNGQASLGLAAHFERVVATDPSATQIGQAAAHPRIDYRVEPAEHGTLAAGSASLVAVSQALHWFDLDAFHAEVRRVAVRLEMPLLIATVNPQTVKATEEWLRKQRLTVVCADPLFGDRVRALHGEEGSDRVRVVLADDLPALDSLDRADPVLLTPAARQRMRRADFRLIAPLSPAFSLDFARKVSEVLVRLHIEAERA